MKIKLSIAAVALMLLFNCGSSGESRRQRVNSCGILCNSHPSVKSMTFDSGGGSLFLLGGGYEKETCNCHRPGS